MPRQDGGLPLLARRLTLAFLILSFVLFACKRKPYVPYQIDSDGSSSVNDASSASINDANVAADGGNFASLDSLTPVTVAGITLVPPTGGRLRGAYISPDGPKNGMLAFADVSDGARMVMRIFKVDTSNGTLAAVASSRELPLAPGCAVALSALPIHAGRIAIDARSRCANWPASGPTRLVSIVHLTPTEVRALVALSFRHDEHADRSHDGLSIVAEAPDLDGDNVPDVRIRVGLQEQASDTIALSWFDRPQGMTRNVADPKATLSNVVDEIRRDTNAIQASERALSLRAVWSLLCGGNSLLLAPRDVCESKPSGLLSSFAATQLLRAGDYAKALAVQEFAESESWSASDRSDVVKAFSALPVAFAKNVRSYPIASVPDGAFGWSPVAFDGDAVKVSTKEGVLRFDSEAAPGAAGLPETNQSGLNLDLAASTGETLVSAHDGCDGLVHLTLMNAEGNATRDITVNKSIGTGGACNSRNSARFPLRPIGETKDGLELAAGTQLIALRRDFSRADAISKFEGKNGRFGSARSANGQHVVLPTKQGLLLLSARPRLVTTKKGEPELGSPADIVGCAVSDRSDRAACLVRGSERSELRVIRW
jgi:hypothetical protein